MATIEYEFRITTKGYLRDQGSAPVCTLALESSVDKKKWNLSLVKSFPTKSNKEDGVKGLNIKRADTRESFVPATESGDSKIRFDGANVWQAVAVIMLTCPDAVKSLKFGNAIYTDIKNIRIGKAEGRRVVFDAERDQGHVKVALPFRVYEVIPDVKYEEKNDYKYYYCEYYDENNRPVTKDSDGAVMCKAFTLAAPENGKVRCKVIRWKKEPDGHYEYEEDEGYCELTFEAYDDFFQSWKKDHQDKPIKLIFLDKMDVGEGLIERTVDVPYELVNDGTGQKLTILPRELTKELMGSQTSTDEAAETADMFFGSAEVGGGLKRGLFYYLNGELTEKYAFCEDPKSDQAEYSCTDMKKSLLTGSPERSVLQLPKDMKEDEEEIRERLRSWLENISSDDPGAFFRLFEKNVAASLKFPENPGDSDGKNDQDKFTYKWQKEGGTERRYIYTLDGVDDIAYHVDWSGDADPTTDYPRHKADGFGVMVIGKEDDSPLRIFLAEKPDNWEISDNEFPRLSGAAVRLIDKSIMEGLTDLGPREGSDIKAVMTYIVGHLSAFRTFRDRLKDIEQEKDNEESEKGKVYKKLRSRSRKDPEKDRISVKLYKDDMVPNEEVVSRVFEEYKSWKENHTREGRIPNFAILGAPGTGKTTIARGLAAVFGYGEDRLIVKSSADLKGAYLGQTGDRVFEMLKEADQNKAIVFIDEAYRLLDDQYGQEALAILLPVMSGDRKTIEKPKTDQTGTGEDLTYTFVNDAPPIWLGGYEKEMRAMLSDNPGLYRRMTILRMPEPAASQLYKSLLRKADNTLQQAFRQNAELIKNYFGWGASWEHAEYFGNYGGVEKFLTSCRIHIKYSSDQNKAIIDENKRIIESVINEKKWEIKRQYRTVLSTQKDENGRSTVSGAFRFEVESDIETTFKNVMGNKNAVKSLREIVDMLLNREEYSEKGIFIPKGMLMYGPPGTGKTLLARAMAGELQQKYKGSGKKDMRVAFIPTASTELIDPYGEPKRIKSLFAQAEDYDAAVIFIDEIDGIGRHRNIAGAHPALLVQLMKEMDGFEERKNIFVIAATNAPDILDPALMREGRFDRHVTVLPPDKEGRHEILKMYLGKLSVCKLDHQDNIAGELAEKTVGFTPAKLKSIVNEAALLFKRYDKRDEESNEKPPYDREGGSEEERFRKDLLEMVKRVSVGERTGGEKESEFSTKENVGWSATAIHEVGHALVSRLLGRSISEITIIPRGMANGYVMPGPDTGGYTRRRLRDEIVIDLGGYAAERLFYGDDYSAGASQDIRTATRLAYDMVTKYGMSDDIGPMALMSEDGGYLGEGGSFNCSDAFRERIDDAVRKLLNECLSAARDMLLANKATIEKIAREVFDKETMDAETFNKVCEDNNI